MSGLIELFELIDYVTIADDYYIFKSNSYFFKFDIEHVWNCLWNSFFMFPCCFWISYIFIFETFLLSLELLTFNLDRLDYDVVLILAASDIDAAVADFSINGGRIYFLVFNVER